MIDRLVELKQSLDKDGLGKRHRMGDLLLKRLGPPTKRHPRGRQVLKRAAERLDMSEGELSRIRWLRHLFASVDELRQRPEISSWTRFKQLLPDLKAPGGHKVRASSGGRSQTAQVQAIARSLNRLTEQFRRMDPLPEGTEREALREAWRELRAEGTRLFAPVEPIA